MCQMAKCFFLLNSFAMLFCLCGNKMAYIFLFSWGIIVIAFLKKIVFLSKETDSNMANLSPSLFTQRLDNYDKCKWKKPEYSAETFWVAGLKLLIMEDANLAAMPDFYVNAIQQRAKAFFNLKLLNYKIEVLDFSSGLGGRREVWCQKCIPVTFIWIQLFKDNAWVYFGWNCSPSALTEGHWCVINIYLHNSKHFFEVAGEHLFYRYISV